MSRPDDSVAGFVVLLVLAIVVGLASAGMLLIWIITPREPAFVVDQGAMVETRSRLRELQTELNSLPQPPGTRALSASQDGCAEDSGDVFQPAATWNWFILRAEGDEVTRELADRLRQLGWRDAAEPTHPGAYYLTKEKGSWAATAYVSRALSHRHIVISAHVKDARPCRLKDEEAS